MSELMTIREQMANIRKTLVPIAAALAGLVSLGVLPEQYQGWAVTALGVLAVVGVYEAPNKVRTPAGRPVFGATPKAAKLKPVAFTAAITTGTQAAEGVPEWAWIVGLVAAALAFVGLEAPALVNDVEGDTLSERLRKWLRTHTSRGRVYWLVGWLTFAGWFAIHIGWVGTI